MISVFQRDIDFRQGYGLTETSPVVCMPKRGSKRYSTVGPALPNTDFRIVDGALNNLGPNEVCIFKFLCIEEELIKK